jgi:hypothetical protein
MRNRWTFGEGVLLGFAFGFGAMAIASQARYKNCEPVVDVQYKRVDKQWHPETVLRVPTRENKRCVLAEVGR